MSSLVTSAFFNEAKDLLVKFRNDGSFVIMGDADLVSDDDLMTLFCDELVDGWEPAPF